jgi:hypothetical protein
MSYHVHHALTRIIYSTVLLIVYLFYVTNQFQANILTEHEIHPWGRVMLIFIGIGIVVAILFEIIFHIFFSIGIAAKETIQNETSDDQAIEKRIKQGMVEDEMSKLIDLKSLKVGYIVIGIGFVTSLFVLTLGYPTYIMINVLFVFFFTAGILEELARLLFYRRGV